MAHTENNIEALVGSQEAFEQLVKERLRQAVRVALISVLEEEVTAFIGVHPYEPSRAASRSTQWTLHAQSGNYGRSASRSARSTNAAWLSNAAL